MRSYIKGIVSFLVLLSIYSCQTTEVVMNNDDSENKNQTNSKSSNAKFTSAIGFQFETTPKESINELPISKDFMVTLATNSNSILIETLEGTQREDLVEYAKKFNKYKSVPKPGRNDCSGFVRFVFQHFGVDIFKLEIDELKRAGEWINGTEVVYKYAQKHGEVFKNKLPKKGDFIFFDNTHDRNNDGKINDYYTHIAIVVDVEDNGTVHYIHKSGSGINLQMLNTTLANQKMDGKRQVNSYLRGKAKSDTSATPHLAAEMFRGYGSIFKDKKSQSDIEKEKRERDAQIKALQEKAAKEKKEREEKAKKDAEAKKKAELDAEAKRKAELDAKAKRKAELDAEAKKKTELDAEAKRKAELDAEAKKKAELDAEAKRKAELDAEAKKKAELDAEAKRKAELDAEAKRKAELEKQNNQKDNTQNESDLKSTIIKEFESKKLSAKATSKKIKEKNRLEKQAREELVYISLKWSKAKTKPYTPKTSAGMLIQLFKQYELNITDGTEKTDTIEEKIYWFTNKNGFLFLSREPQVGDFVFFDDGGVKKTIIDIGLVLNITDNGDVTYLHLVNGKEKFSVMNRKSTKNFKKFGSLFEKK
ncbi:C40 family peptidase [bacterium]|nr:C40 family peptidase [bacterium]